MKNILNNYWVKLGIMLLVLFFIVAYLLGLVFQVSNNYIQFLNSPDGNIFSGGKFNALSDIRFSPLANYKFLFSLKLALPVVFIFFLLSSSFFIRFFSQFLGRGTKDAKRGFRYAKGGTYGTAGWLTAENLKGIAKVNTWRTAEGYILGQLDTTQTKLINTDNKSVLNKHVAVFGASGSGKTRGYVKNYIIQSVKRKESIIVTDPKGELFEDSAQFLRDNGYVVKIFNLVNPERSDSWNCLKEIKGNELMAQVFADTVIKNTSMGGHGDHFWDNSEMNLLKALILRVERGEDFKNLNKQNMGMVYDLLTKATGEIGLEDLFNPRNLSAEEKCCLAPYNIFKQSAENVRGGIVLGLGTRVQVFQNEVIKKITEYDDIDLTLPGKQPCAYFCIMSDQDSTLNFLSSLFFSFLFIDLVRYADLNGGKCDVPVNFILDEFPNIGQIVDFTKKISTVRSRGINISIIFQAISQLENRYPDGMWQEILGNCDTHLFLGCNDPNTAKFISDRAGEVTINVNTAQMNRNTRLSPTVNKGVRESAGEGKRKLLTMDEVMRTPLDESLIIFRGQNALKAYKYYYDYHPRSKEFIKTYIREYPSIFDREQLLKEKQLIEKEEERIRNEKKANTDNSQEKIFQEGILVGDFKTVIKSKPSYSTEPEISDLEKLKLVKTQNTPTNNKPKKDIFLNNNQRVAKNTSNKKTPEPIVPQEVHIIKQEDSIPEANQEEEVIYIGELISEEIILEGSIEDYQTENEIIELPLVREVEKNQEEQFDKEEKVLHNRRNDELISEEHLDVKINTQTILPHKTKNNSTKKDDVQAKKNDPIFDKDFFSSTGKVWKPGDISQRTRERLEKKKLESLEPTNQLITPDTNGLLIKKKT